MLNIAINAINKLVSKSRATTLSGRLGPIIMRKKHSKVAKNISAADNQNKLLMAKSP
jgi:hypothetical protein